MEEFVIYMLKVGLWISLFGILYWLFFRKETFYHFNRVYLLSGLVLSFIIPLIQLQYTVETSSSISYDTLAVNAGAQTSNSFLNWTVVLLCFYLAGAMTLFVRYAVGVKKITKLLALHPSEKIKECHLIDSPAFQQPFSVFNYIFVNKKTMSTEAEKVILEHELAHIRQKHWIDLLICNIICLVQWFNPFVWLYVKAIKQNHEYLADRSVLQNGSSRGMYQAVLLSYTLNVPSSVLIHSFAHPNKTNRFLMMKKTISNPLRKWAIMLILPIVAVFLWAFSQPVYVTGSQLHQVPEFASLANDSTSNGHASADTSNSVKIKRLVIPNESSPLLFVNGKEIPYTDLQSINASDIESISVLKDQSANSIYGKRGENGVILITTKAPPR